MIDGVTKIAEQDVPDRSIFLSAVFIFILLVRIAMIGCACGIAHQCIMFNKTRELLSVEFFMLIIMALMFTGAGIQNIVDMRQNKTHTEYIVTIDENCKYLDFVENYEVVSEENGVYWVIEKEKNNE